MFLHMALIDILLVTETQGFEWSVRTIGLNNFFTLLAERLKDSLSLVQTKNSEVTIRIIIKKKHIHYVVLAPPL